MYEIVLCFICLKKKIQTRRATEWAFYRLLQATHRYYTHILLYVVQRKHNTLISVGHTLPSPPGESQGKPCTIYTMVWWLALLSSRNEERTL